jgi:hypothetical protein
MIAFIIVVGFVAAGLIIGSSVTSSAPVGYEDEAGFHLGQQPGGTITDHQPLPEIAGLTPKHA